MSSDPSPRAIDGLLLSLIATDQPHTVRFPDEWAIYSAALDKQWIVPTDEVVCHSVVDDIWDEVFGVSISQKGWRHLQQLYATLSAAAWAGI